MNVQPKRVVKVGCSFFQTAALVRGNLVARLPELETLCNCPANRLRNSRRGLSDCFKALTPERLDCSDEPVHLGTAPGAEKVHSLGGLGRMEDLWSLPGVGQASLS